jgi:hypothetical protein
LILGKFRNSVTCMGQAVRIEMRQAADGSYIAGRRSATGTRLDTHKISAPNPEAFRAAAQDAVSGFCPGREVIIEENSVGRVAMTARARALDCIAS